MRRKEMPDKELVRPGFQLEKGVWFTVRKLALEQRRDSGYLMREAINDYLRKHGHKGG